MQAQLELAPVDQTRERIVTRLIRQLPRQLMRFGDVRERAFVVDDLSLIVTNRAGVLQHDGPVAGLGLQPQERGQPQAVGQVQVEQNDIDRVLARAQPGQPFAEGANDLQLERLIADQSQLLAEQLLVLGVRMGSRSRAALLPRLLPCVVRSDL